MFTKGAQADAAALRRHQRLDLTFVNADGELGAARDVQLGVLRPLRFAAGQDALADRVHCRMEPAGTTPVPPTVSSEMRMVGWPTDTGTPCPSLPQVPGASFRSLATMSILCKARGPLPTMVAPRTGRPMRGATIVGNGPRALHKIDMVANDLKLAPGTCGKEGQGVPVSVGQPTIRISELTVGGTGVVIPGGAMRP